MYALVTGAGLGHTIHCCCGPLWAIDLWLYLFSCIVLEMYIKCMTDKLNLIRKTFLSILAKIEEKIGDLRDFQDILFVGYYFLTNR